MDRSPIRAFYFSILLDMRRMELGLRSLFLKEVLL